VGRRGQVGPTLLSPCVAGNLHARRPESVSSHIKKRAVNWGTSPPLNSDRGGYFHRKALKGSGFLTTPPRKELFGGGY